TVYGLVRQAYSWVAVQAEIAKCVVRCANCHHRRTAQQFQWAKLTFERTQEPLGSQQEDPPRIRTMQPTGIASLRRFAPLTASISDVHRFCLGCGQTKPVEEFHFRSKRRRTKH